MSLQADKDGKSYIDVPNPSEGHREERKLKRRVARFDILNNAAYSNFTITKIHITKAQRQVLLQDVSDTDNQALKWDNQDRLGNQVIGAAAANGTTPTSLEDTHDASGGEGADGIPDVFQGIEPKLDSLERNEAVFYLYPTILTSLDLSVGDKTEIVIEGKLGNETNTRLYTLTLPKEMNEFPIYANTLYSIKVQRNGQTPDTPTPEANKITIEATPVKAWFVDEPPVEAEPNDAFEWSATWGGIQINDGNKEGDTWEANQTFWANAEKELIISATCLDLTNDPIIEVNITKQSGNNIEESDIFTIPRPKSLITYGARYTTTYTIKTPKLEGDDKSLDTKIEIKKGKDGTAIAVINLTLTSYDPKGGSR
jgi:hypothetical protein